MRRLRWTSVFQYHKEGWREDGDTLFMRTHDNRRKKYKHKLLQGKFSLCTSSSQREQLRFGISCPKEYVCCKYSRLNLKILIWVRPCFHKKSVADELQRFFGPRFFLKLLFLRFPYYKRIWKCLECSLKLFEPTI